MAEVVDGCFLHFPPQGLKPGLPHCRQILYQLSNKGSPRTLDWVAAAAAAKSLQSCPTLCDPIDSSPPGCDIHRAKTVFSVF